MSSKITAFGGQGGIRRMITLKSGDGLRCMSLRLLMRPQADGDLDRCVQWLLMAHARRYPRHYGTSGHVWQGRFKAFIIQDDDHLRTALRYVGA
jgi:hypothetical protein